MAQNDIPLNLAVFSKDAVYAGMLRIVFQATREVSLVQEFTAEPGLISALNEKKVNSVIIDFGHVGGEDSIKVISRIREQFPSVPICLAGPADVLLAPPNVPMEWRKRLQHYVKFAPNQPLDTALQEATAVVDQLRAYLLRATARERVQALQKSLQAGTQDFSQADNVGEVLQLASTALEKPAQNAPASASLPDFNQGAVQDLVLKTLEATQRSLNSTALTNKIVVGTGLLLLVTSFVAGVYHNNYASLGFGSLGTAAMIASLVTNPLKSLSAGSRRIVQVQVAYLGFLTQLSMVRALPAAAAEKDLIERIKALGDQVENSLKVLAQHFE